MVRPTDFWPVVTYAGNEETRRRLLIGVGSGCKENLPVFKEEVVLRSEVGKLLRYPNHALLRIGGKTAETPEPMDTFLKNLWAELAETVKQKHISLSELKKTGLVGWGLVASLLGHLLLPPQNA